MVEYPSKPIYKVGEIIKAKAMIAKGVAVICISHSRDTWSFLWFGQCPYFCLCSDMITQ